MTSGCTGNPLNCQLLIAVASLHRDRCVEAGITDQNAVVNAMAVGLVEEIWRNGPVEDMHSSRRGPSDAAMFAESTDYRWKQSKPYDHSHATKVYLASSSIFSTGTAPGPAPAAGTFAISATATSGTNQAQPVEATPR